MLSKMERAKYYFRQVRCTLSKKMHTFISSRNGGNMSNARQDSENFRLQSLSRTRQRSRRYASLRSVDVTGCSVSLSDHIKILGVTLDSHLSLDKHISFICKSAYYHIRSLRHIRSAITDHTVMSVASSLVCSCMAIRQLSSLRHY